MPAGRPSDYSQEFADKLCAQLADAQKLWSLPCFGRTCGLQPPCLACKQIIKRELSAGRRWAREIVELERIVRT